MDWFLIKKAIAIYLQPLMIFIELVMLGVVLITFSRKRPRKKPTERWRLVKRMAGQLGIALIVLATFFLYLCSIRPFANSLTYALENRYPPLDLNHPDVQALDPDYIVVLAGGQRYNTMRPVSSQLTARPSARMLEALRLREYFKRAQLVVTGTPLETKAMAATAEFLGIGEAFIENESRDTKDHPVYLKPILQDSRFVLVTSASHMPRAMALFEAQGLTPIPGPGDFRVWPAIGESTPYEEPRNFIPQAAELEKTEIAFHEYLGIIWADIRGQLKRVPEVETTPPPMPPEPSELIEL